MKKWKSVFVTVLVFAFMIGTTAIQGSATTQTVYMRTGQLVALSHYVERSGSSSYVLVKCDSVYPPSGTDNYQRMQCSLRSGTTLQYLGKKDADVFVVLKEGEGYKKIYLEEDSLYEKGVIFYFRGNDPDKDAYANVTYDPK